MVKRGVPISEEVPVYKVSDELMWPVCKEYHIANSAITPVAHIVKGEYSPLSVPNLFHQFAQLFNDIEPANESDDKSKKRWDRESGIEILKWVSDYGELHKFEAGKVDEKKGEDMLQKTSLEYYQSQVSKAYRALDHYKAFCDTKTDGYMDYKGLKIYQYTFNEFLEEAPLSNIRLGFKLEGNPPELRPLYIPDSLLAALWLQFWQIVSGQSEMGQCDYCGRSFVLTHGNRHFCPPKYAGFDYNGNYYRSSCENGYNQWLHRRKRKATLMFNEGKSVKDVTAILSKEKYHIEQSKVLEWWDKWKR